MNHDALQADKLRLEQYRLDAEKDPSLRDMYAEVIGALEKALVKKQSALDAYLETGDGTILRHPTRDRWVMLLPDASRPGKYRTQEFGYEGFIGHQCFESPEEAAIDAGSNGYTLPDPDRLDVLAATPRWQDGMAITLVIQDMNAGRLTWAEADEKVTQIKAARTAQSPVQLAA